MPQERVLEQKVEKEIREVIMDIAQGAYSRPAGPVGHEGDIGRGLGHLGGIKDNETLRKETLELLIKPASKETAREEPLEVLKCETSGRAAPQPSVS